MARYGSYKAQIRAIEQKLDISSEQKEKLFERLMDEFKATALLEFGDDDAITKSKAAKLPETLKLCEKYDVAPAMVKSLIESEA